MKKYIFFFVIMVISFQNSFSQITFERTYGGLLQDQGRSARQTTDNGYIVAGVTNSFGYGENDAYLIKTDEYGDTVWTKTYGGSMNDWAYSVWQCYDDGYVAAGSTMSFGVGSDFYLVRTDVNGDTLWTRFYGGSNDDVAYAVQQTSDSGFILAGSTSSYGLGSSDTYIIKTDATGDTIWTKFYGGNGSESGQSIQQTNDNGYIVAGSTLSFGVGKWDMHLIKTDPNGDTIWTKTYGGAEDDFAYSVQQTNDNGFIIAGATNSFSSGTEPDVYLVKTDSIGDTIWTKTYGGPLNDFSYSVQQTNDNGYIIVGTTYMGTKRDVFLIKTDAAGDTLWTRTFGSTETEIGYSVMQTNDNGYIIGGSNNSLTSGVFDVYLIKTTADGILTSLFDPIIPGELSIYPNPTNGIFYIDLAKDAFVVDIANIHGQLVIRKELNTNMANSTYKLDLSSQPKGVYFISVKSITDIKCGKLLIR